MTSTSERVMQARRGIAVGGLVRNYGKVKIANLSHDKLFYEKYALLSLIYCYKTELSVMLQSPKSECPDWQSIQLDLGLEVTRVLSKTEGEREFVMSQYLGKGLDITSIRQDISKRFPKFKNLFQSCNNIKYVSWPINYSQIYSTIIKTIIKKTKSLNKNYTIYKNNWLYVFMETTPLDNSDIKKIVEQFETVQFTGLYYDKIFINGMDTLYVINSDKSYHTIPISSDILHRLNEDSSLT